MKKTIGVFAHVDAGKTTFSEQILYHTKGIRQRGRVDHQDAFLDDHEIERQRGITVFAEQAMFSFCNSDYFLIDTPGHVDFSPEMARMLQVLDAAILIVSAVEGIEGHTETVWELLRKHRVPTFLFINKVDRVGADVTRVLAEIRANFSKDVYDITDINVVGVLSEDLIEFLAEREDVLLDQYLEFGYDQELWQKVLREMVKNGAFFPVSSGSALQDQGIKEFLDKIDFLTETSYSPEGKFMGRVYKIRHDEKGTKIVFIKALQGTLKVRDELTYGEKRIKEKVTQIRLYHGTGFQVVPKVEAGQLFAVTGLTETEIGDGVGELVETKHEEMIPTLKAKVQFESGINIKEAIRYFSLLDAEDPSLHVTWEETLQELHIHVMGMIQLEVLEQLVADRFGIKATFGQPEIIYKETINTTVMGYGHFEPLKHYAEVHLKLEPGERNSGITFENQCSNDDLAPGYQNLVEQHLFERDHHGILTGSAVTDMKVILVTGRAHNKHTSGGDFREATFRALRQGLEKAKVIILEPVYRFKIKVGVDLIGRIMADVQAAHGRCDAPQTDGDKAIVTGIVPVSTFMNYSTQLAAFTHGKGSINLVVSGYERCHNEQEVIEKIGYDKNADPEYTSSSIFCAKGQGYTVRWNEAEAKMHALK